MTITKIAAQKNIILVGVRSNGHSGGEQLHNINNIVKNAVEKLQLNYDVHSVTNQDLGFISEIKAVQSAKILISVHGTISYMSLFARDDTQQIILYDPAENRFKEHNILMYATHFNAMYYPWDQLDHFEDILKFAVNKRNRYEEEEEQKKNMMNNFWNHITSC
jgi:hypothetical protein